MTVIIWAGWSWRKFEMKIAGFGEVFWDYFILIVFGGLGTRILMGWVCFIWEGCDLFKE